MKDRAGILLSAPQHALGMAWGCEAHAKLRGSGTGLPCSEPSALLSSLAG